MSKSSRATPTPDLVRELREDELQEVSGGQKKQITKMKWDKITFEVGLDHR